MELTFRIMLDVKIARIQIYPDLEEGGNSKEEAQLLLWRQLHVDNGFMVSWFHGVMVIALIVTNHGHNWGDGESLTSLQSE